MNKFNVALIGRPNVGKSTLFNRLIGKKKAIVSTIPGTTRDRIKGEIDHNDQIINITDVGGFTDDQIDQFSDEIKEQINYSLNNCDLIIMITDGNEGITSTDKNVAQIIRNTNKKSILVVNKIDNNEKQYNINDFFELGFENILGISAYHNGSHNIALGLKLSGKKNRKIRNQNIFDLNVDESKRKINFKLSNMRHKSGI